MATSPVELTLLISAGSTLIGVAARNLLLLVVGIAAVYAKTPSRRKAAAGLAQLLLTVPWRRGSDRDRQAHGAQHHAAHGRSGRVSHGRIDLEDADEATAL
jgi:hypothetical protein